VDEAAAALRRAAELGDQLVAEAIWDSGRAIWLGDDRVPIGGDWVVAHRSVDGSLYGGTAGIALFLSRLAAAGGDPAVARTARGALAHAQEWVRRTRPAGSLYSGSLGVAVATGEAARLLADDGLHRQAVEATRIAMERSPDPADLIAGRAGAVLGLLEMSRLVDLPDAAELAHRIGRTLVADAARTPGGGCSWASDLGADEPSLCGLAHGASGIALALAELGVAVGDRSMVDTACAGLDFERSWYSPEHRNWPDLRELTRDQVAGGALPAWPEYWCHGALGIGMTRLRLFDITRRPLFGAELGVGIDAALAVLTAAVAVGDEVDMSLCHGVGGAVDLLVEAGRVLHRPGLIEAARAGVLELTDGRSPAVPWGCGINGGGENPSLMVGLAGIGMMFLRLADSGVPAPCAALSGGVMADRVIVQLERPVEREQLTRRAAELRTLVPGASVVRVSPRGRVILLLETGTDLDSAITVLGGEVDVEFAEPDVIDRATSNDSTPDDSTPDDSTPDDSTPDDSTPDNSTPDRGGPDR